MNQVKGILNKNLVDAVIKLEDIYLDPNNPRFTFINENDVSNECIIDINIQKETREKLKNFFSIAKLMENIKVNGFLTIDRIVVKKIYDDKYVVLEGNRRICAAKEIMDIYKNQGEINADVIETLKKINCMIYTGEENEAAWIFQGLRHIIGIQEWPAYNKAKLLVKLLENEKLTLTEVGKKFGLSSYGTAQWARGYYAFKQALEESDYTEEIDEKAYPYLQEIFGRSNTAFREWLMWNDRKYRFEDELKFNEFLSWLYPRDEINELDEIEVKGKWECRVLKRSDDLRILSSLLRNSMKDFEMFREDKDLEKARSQASMQKYLKSTVKEHKTIININECIKALEDIPLKLVKEQGEKLSELLLELEQKVSEILEVYKFL